MSNHNTDVTVIGPDGITRRVPEALTRTRAFKIQKMRILPPSKALKPVPLPEAFASPAPLSEDSVTEEAPARRPGRPKKTQVNDADQA